MENPFEKLNNRLMNLETVYLKIDERLKVALVTAVTPPPERYLTKKQVMELMQVTSTAIWNYEKRGLLKRCEFGGAVRYRISDIEAGLEFIKNPKK